MSINFADHFQNSTTTFMSAEKRDQILQPIKSFCALTQCTIFFFLLIRNSRLAIQPLHVKHRTRYTLNKVSI